MVSIIIPVYNGEKYIEEALNSVFNQTYTDYEIIVVDDGSTDNTVEIVKKYKNVRYVYQKNAGPAAARNKGIRMSKGEIISLLDSDDLYTKDKLEKQVDFLEKNKEIDICFSKYKNFYDDINKINDNQRKVFERNIDHFLPSACIRREVFERCGYFDHELRSGDDTEWINRMMMFEKEKTTILNEIGYLRRIHGESITTNLNLAVSTAKSMAAKSVLNSFKIKKGMKLAIIYINNEENKDIEKIVDSLMELNWIGDKRVYITYDEYNNQYQQVLDDNNVVSCCSENISDLIENIDADYLLLIKSTDYINDDFYKNIYKEIKTADNSIVYYKDNYLLNSKAISKLIVVDNADDLIRKCSDLYGSR